MLLLQALFAVLAGLLFIPAAILFVQVVAARPEPQPRLAPHARRPRLAVLVPAHDEAVGIASCVRPLLAQLAPGDRLLVVADNCTDRTAALAAGAGAEVIERRDAERRGKGYALDFGIRFLERDPPEVAIVIDADCLAGEGAIDRLARACARHRRPVQALDLMYAPPGAGLGTHIAEFAWVVKNRVRPLGYRRLGLPCQLMGTGMAFPWPLLRTAALGDGQIVEDLKLGLDLACLGKPPLFCPDARVSSFFPAAAASRQSQRQRWEHGHLGMLCDEAPRLLGAAIARRDRALLALALDLCVPPLSLLALALVALAAAGGLLALAAGQAPAAWPLAAAALALFAGAVALAWRRFGRKVISLRQLAAAPLYALRKLPLYASFLGHRQMDWVRSARLRH